MEEGENNCGDDEEEEEEEEDDDGVGSSYSEGDCRVPSIRNVTEVTDPIVVSKTAKYKNWDMAHHNK